MTTFNVKVIMIRCSDQGSSAFEFWCFGGCLELMGKYVFVDRRFVGA